jgi:hypothetical protein
MPWQRSDSVPSPPALDCTGASAYAEAPVSFRGPQLRRMELSQWADIGKMDGQSYPETSEGCNA